jgi:hypothetical protein
MILDIAIAILKVWCLLLAFGLAGLPFSLGLFGTYRFGLLMAPMSGLLGMSIVLLAIYHILNLTFQTSALLAAMLLAGLACASFVIRRPERRDLRSALISLVIIAIVGAACALVVDTASIVNRDLAVPLLHGTDQAGYATNAEWLVKNLASHRPVKDPFDTGQIHTEFVFTHHARLLPFAGLAVSSAILGIPTFYVYQTFCAVALAMAICSVAAVTSKYFTIVAGSLLLLMMAHWFDYAHSGFLGKLLGFPASLATVILLLRHFDDSRPLPGDALGALCVSMLLAGVCISHSPTASGMFLLAAAIPYWAFRQAGSERLPLHGLFQQAALLCLVLFALVSAAGLLARFLPLYHYPRGDAPWSAIFPFYFDLAPKLDAAFTVALLAHFVVAATGIVLRNAASAALAVGPLIVVGLLYLTANKALGLQLAGYSYPALVCAVAILADRHLQSSNGQPRAMFVPAMLLFVAIAIFATRVPRFASSAAQFSAMVPEKPRVFLKREFDAMAQLLNGHPFRVEVDSPYHAVALSVGLERRVKGLQWGPHPWRWVGGYARVPLPVYPSAASFVVYRKGDARAASQPKVLTTSNFEIVRP